MTDDAKLPLPALAGFGITQIIGYGTLYYAFSVLVPDMARDIGKSEQWVFGAFSAALLVGSLAAPFSGRLADRFGATRVMSGGSIASALSLVLAAMAPDAWTFATAVVVMQVISATVLYASAFTAVVQLGGRRAQTSIVHLTLIAGFASTIFWPLTSWLHHHLPWREIYFSFAALNLLLCAPIHFRIARMPAADSTRGTAGSIDHVSTASLPERTRQVVFVLMMAGFAIEGYALSAMLVHIVPLTQTLGLGATGLFIASLFGPAQVASRLINLVFGQSLSQTWLAVISAVFLPLGLTILLLTVPSFPGAVVFAICMGLGSGLTSIVGGTLPLELFGRAGFGKLMGWSTLAKQITAGVAPFLMAVSLTWMGVVPSLVITIVTALIGAVVFLAIPFVLAAAKIEEGVQQQPVLRN